MIKDRLQFFLLGVLTFSAGQLVAGFPSTPSSVLPFFSSPICKLSYCFLASSHSCTRSLLGGFLQGRRMTFLLLPEDRSYLACSLLVSEASDPWAWGDEVTLMWGCAMAEKTVFQKWRPSKERSPQNSASSLASLVRTVSLRPPTSLKRRQGNGIN